MSDEQDKQVMLEKGGMVDIEAVAIAEIIFQTCHCGTERCTKAANLILEYISKKIVDSGAGVDVTPPEGPKN